MDNIDNERKRIHALLDKYGDHNVNLSGYSLGGGRALEVMSDKRLYSRLGEDNWLVAPGVTALNPNLKNYANMTKAHFAYSSSDAVANSLLAHKSDHHHVSYSYDDPLNAHTTYLSDLAK